MTLNHPQIITALRVEIQRQAGGDCTMHQTGFNALVQAADVVKAAESMFQVIAPEPEVEPEPITEPVPGWETV